MAKFESDREDILREATALVQRVELQSPDNSEPITAGFRTSGAACFYFGAEPVYQFNSAGEFRRGYLNGQLIKAENNQLATLRRERTETQVVLRRTDLSPPATAQIIEAAEKDLKRLLSTLQSGDYSIHGQVPTDADIVGRLIRWLEEHHETITIAKSPRAR